MPEPVVPAKTKNPKRVAAGRANRALRGPVGLLTRERLSRAAIRNQPWLHSTGPRTQAGKKKSAQNGRRRGCRASVQMPMSIFTQRAQFLQAMIQSVKQKQSGAGQPAPTDWNKLLVEQLSGQARELTGAPASRSRADPGTDQ